MGRLNFTLNSETNKWECEQKNVNGAFGLNILTHKVTFVDVMVKAPEAPDEAYAYIRKNGNNNQNTYFEQFAGEVWPLDIKIVCGVEPTFATMILA